MSGDGLRDVIVAGGGPAGCAAAILLKERGHDVLLLDAARFPRDKICGESVSPGAWSVLRDLGVVPRLEALHPWPLRGMALTSPDGTSFEGRYRGIQAPGFAIRRESLDLLLLERARECGVEVREGARVCDVLFHGGVVGGVFFENGGGPECARGRIVIGAEGRRSVVARRLALLREDPSLRKFAVRGYWEGMQGLSEHGEMHVGGGGYCGIAPLSATRANVAFVLDRRELTRAGGDLAGFYERTIAERWPRVRERLRRAERQGPPRAIGPLALKARHVSAPGSLLVGDAAGFHDPFTGEGVTLALRSAAIACETADAALRSGRATDLSSYDRRRHAATRDKFRFNRLLQHVVAWPCLADHLARRLATRPALADRLVGVAGDFVPARTAIGPSLLWDLLRS